MNGIVEAWTNCVPVMTRYTERFNSNLMMTDVHTSSRLQSRPTPRSEQLTMLGLDFGKSLYFDYEHLFYDHNLLRSV